MQKIFIATGGTGGHIIPARCLAKNLAQNGEKVFVLADEKYKSYIKNDDNFSCFIINSSKRKSGFGLFLMFVKIAIGFLQSFYYFLKFRPNFVYSFGGYATFPILLCAIIFRKKIILHEQNAHLGKVNRIFAKFAYKIALTFEKTTAISPKFLTKTVVTGNPLRQEIADLNNKNYQIFQEVQLKKRDKMGYEGLILAGEFDDFEEFLQEKKYFNILVLGGSGGAKIFSEILPQAFYNLNDEIKNNIFIMQQCRKDLSEETFLQYKKLNINVEISHFFEDMVKKIDEAHLVIARSGSSSLVEFAAAKKPMILVPFALAADNHQLKNARIFEEKNAALIVEEKDFNINNLTKIITNLFKNPQKLIEMSKNCEKIAILDADKKLANLIK